MSVPASDTVAVAFITLKGGLIVPLEALQLAWALETRGAIFAVEGAELIIEGPSGFLAEEDRAAIRRWRDPLKAIAGHRAPEVVE